jgi:hypothetical protein
MDLSILHFFKHKFDVQFSLRIEFLNIIKFSMIKKYLKLNISCTLGLKIEKSPPKIYTHWRLSEDAKIMPKFLFYFFDFIEFIMTMLFDIL